MMKTILRIIALRMAMKYRPAPTDCSTILSGNTAHTPNSDVIVEAADKFYNYIRKGQTEAAATSDKISS